MIDLASLNPPQRAAVLHGDGPLVVFAGAGSGKTRVITYRIAHLVSERAVPAYRILAVTFTNKAAAEMRSRIFTLLTGGGPSPWIGTFHSICARLLRRHAEALGLSPQFVIYDDTDQKALINRIIREFDLDDRRFPWRDLSRYIEQQKQQLLRPADISPESAYEEVAHRVYTAYEQRIQACNALDFNDLLVRMVHGLREHAGVREHLQKMWSYILVDEFQDTNLVQLELVRILAEHHRNLCVVGDDDQSIYKWRGADRRNILDFRSSFADAEVVKLEQNYRSTSNILGAAMAVISKNHDREPKQLFTENGPGQKLRVVKCYDERDEARAITEAIRALRDGHKLSEMAIFYRTHAQSRVLEEEMRASRMAYRVVGGQRFYERAEVKDVLAYMRVLSNPVDDVSLLRIVNVPARGIGKTTVDKVIEQASQRGKSVWETLATEEVLALLPRGSAKKIEAFVAMMVSYMAKAKAGDGPAELAKSLLDEIGYLSALRDADTIEADGRIENVEELLSSMREFEGEAEEPTLANYLELITLQTNADEIDDSDKLTLMTVHAAKGLEFPVVWVAGLEERLFPLMRESFISDEDLEEERRLAYVAFTRAEQRLYISHARTRRLHGESMLALPSRFLKEIPAELVHEISRVSETTDYAGGGGGYGSGSRYEYDAPARFGGNTSFARAAASGSAGRPTARPRAATPRAPSGATTPSLTGVRGGGSSVQRESYVDRSETDAGEITQGARVRHAKFGEGEVLRVEPGRPPKVTVRFANAGQKQVLASFLEPA